MFKYIIVKLSGVVLLLILYIDIPEDRRNQWGTNQAACTNVGNIFNEIWCKNECSKQILYRTQEAMFCFSSFIMYLILMKIIFVSLFCVDMMFVIVYQPVGTLFLVQHVDVVGQLGRFTIRHKTLLYYHWSRVIIIIFKLNLVIGYIFDNDILLKLNMQLLSANEQSLW